VLPSTDGQILPRSSARVGTRPAYRVLEEDQEVRERHAHLRHPKYAAPKLFSPKPNQLWSWDITKPLGPTKWTYFYLYVVLDVFSRYAVAAFAWTRGQLKRGLQVVIN